MVGGGLLVSGAGSAGGEEDEKNDAVLGSMEDEGMKMMEKASLFDMP